MSASTATPAGEATVDGVAATDLPLGAHVHADGSASFLVWAPHLDALHVRLHDSGRSVPLDALEYGYHATVATGVGAGERYSLLLGDGRELPDPASRLQPEGIHGPSQIVARDFPWKHDTWSAPELRDMVMYELHVGTFTPAGTFDAAADRLRELRDLGINAVELLPISQFPGPRNWGYDGVLAFSTQNSYGGPEALKRFVDAAHGLGMAVVLDVVYNHIGPEGNYLPVFGPYFTATYHTPWGAALNFDEAHSDEVRRYFVDSALQWVDEFRVDALRLDAIHAIHDRSAQPFLREITAAVHRRAAELGRTATVIGESDLGDPRVIRDERLGGHGMDAQWLDDFHHSLRTLLTGEDSGYYSDYGSLAQHAKAHRHGYVYDGTYSRFRGRRHGAPGPDILPRQFIVYSQNHDQVGNRMMGERLSTTVTPAQCRLAAASVLLSSFTPMLFMGEEYGETRPFPYFVSHGDEALVEAVRTGRREEFASFSWQGEPPDPQAEETFRSAILDWSLRERDGHRHLLALYRRLLEVRRTARAIRHADSIATEMFTVDGADTPGDGSEGVIVIRRRAAGQSSLLLLNFAATDAHLRIGEADGAWARSVDTSDTAFGGPGSGSPDVVHGPVLDLSVGAHSAVLLLHDEV